MPRDRNFALIDTICLQNLLNPRVGYDLALLSLPVSVRVAVSQVHGVIVMWEVDVEGEGVAVTVLFIKSGRLVAVIPATKMTNQSF